MLPVNKLGLPKPQTVPQTPNQLDIYPKPNEKQINNEKLAFHSHHNTASYLIDPIIQTLT